MELTKEINSNYESHIITLKDGYKTLKMNYAGNGDLYMSMTEGRRLDNRYGDSIFLDIQQEDGSIFDIFYNLYGRIMDKHKKNPRNLVDIENNIVWLDDDKKDNEADKFMIQNYGEVIRIKFIRISEEKSFSRKNSRSINIRFCMSGSRYSEYAYEFAKAFSELEGIEKGRQYRKG